MWAWVGLEGWFLKQGQAQRWQCLARYRSRRGGEKHVLLLSPSQTPLPCKLINIQCRESQSLVRKALPLETPRSPAPKPQVVGGCFKMGRSWKQLLPVDYLILAEMPLFTNKETKPRLGINSQSDLQADLDL